MKVILAFFINIAFNFAVGLLVAKFLGPEEYGRFALAFATAAVVQTAFLDWLRLGATRFYSERTRDENPTLRATLDVAFALLTAFLAFGSLLLFLLGIHFPLSNALIALALGAAVANGLFDFNTALVRSRFDNTLYVKLLVVKNTLALLLTGGGAFYFGSARMALLGGILSLAGSVIMARAALADPDAEFRLARRETAFALLRYGAPIVASNLLYLCIPLANRALVTLVYGFAETGQFALAHDIGTKAVQAIGSTLDVVLFQLAVAAHDRFGADDAKRRVGGNMAIVLAIIAPACAGIWLVLPSMQNLIVPAQYRGPFEQLLTLMLPGFFSFGMILYAVNPIFQITKRTGPLIFAAIVALGSDLAILYALPRSLGIRGLAIAQSGAFTLALFTLLAIASRSKPVWPSVRDIVATAGSTAVMAVVLLPLRSHPPSFTVLCLQVTCGLGIYGTFVAVLDIARLRSLIRARIEPAFARLRTS